MFPREAGGHRRGMQDLSGVPGDKMISRRQFLTVAGAGALSIAAQRALATSDNHAPTRIPAREGATAVPAVNGRVVVVGGGMGGATAARFLKLWGGAQLQVILIEKNLSYTSNILSNLVLTGQKTISGLQYAYAQLQAIGVTVMQGEVLAINAGPRTLSLAGGQLISYDRLVLSPGIDFDLLPGLANYDDIVHAWQAGPQTTRLAQQLQAMPAGGVFVMTIPAAPYRCPPGPYERACVVADYVQRLKPGSKVIVLDANPNVMAERHTFETAFGGIFANTVEYHSGVTINSIDAATRTIDTSIGAIAGAVLNPIPPHRAGRLVRDNGLANVGGRWAGVNVLTYESTAQPFVHVIGDASSTTQPKAGHIANAEAKVCADAILHLMAGEPVNGAPVTNSACYSPITSTTASWLTAIYHYDPISQTMKTPGPMEADSPTGDGFETMGKWFANLMKDTFG